MCKSKKTSIYFLGMILFYAVTCYFILPLFPKRFFGNNSGIIVGQLIVIIPTILYILISKGEVLKDIPFKPIGGVNILLLILLTYFLTPLISLINAISMLFVDNAVASTITENLKNPFLLNIFLMAVLPAFVEEFAFRGIIFGGMRNSGIRKAAIASAVIFGLFHMNINQMAYATVMGLIFILIREGTGSIFSSMIVHFVFNANSVIMVKVSSMLTDTLEKISRTDSGENSLNGLSEQLSNANASTNLRDFSPQQLLATFGVLIVWAGIFTTIAVFIFILIAKRSHRLEHVKQIVFGKNNRKKADFIIPENESEYTEPASTEYGGKILNLQFIVGIAVCVLLMINAMAGIF